MRKISFWLFIFVFTASLARAQDDAAQQQIDKLSGQIQDVLDAQAAQGKRLDALEKQISDLQDKLNAPGASGNVSADDLKKLAEQVQEIDKKRQSDNEQILKELEKLDKALGVAPTKGRAANTSTITGTNSATANGPQKGYEHQIAQGDTLAAIAKAYSESSHHKITVKQILEANPGLNPNNMTVGKKIFIPDANAK